MQLFAWVAMCLVVAAALRNRPVALVGVAIALRISIPSVAASFATGQEGAVQLQPASYFVVCALIVSILSRPQTFNREIGRHLWFYGTLALFAAVAMIVTSQLRGAQSMVIFVDTYVAGVFLLLLVRTTIISSARAGRSIAITFVSLATAEAIIAIIQWTVKDTLIWKDYLTGFYWYSPTGTTVTGTIGAWLDIGIVLAVAVPLAAAIRQPFYRFSAAIVLIIGIFATERRTPLIVASLGLAFLLFVSKMPTTARILSLLGVVIAAWAVLSSDLTSGVSGRFDNDTISGEVRDQALDYFLAKVLTQPPYGTGFGSNGAVQGLISSFENGYTMYAWDFGIVPTLLLIIALLSQLILAIVRRSEVPGAIFAYASALALIATYSGLETQGPGSWVLFLAAGICSTRITRPLEGPDKNLRTIRVQSRPRS